MTNVNHLANAVPVEKIVFQDRVVEVPYEKVVYQDKVNIEVDVTAKYVEKSMAALVGRVEELEREVASLKSK